MENSRVTMPLNFYRHRFFLKVINISAIADIVFQKKRLTTVGDYNAGNQTRRDALDKITT